MRRRLPGLTILCCALLLALGGAAAAFAADAHTNPLNRDPIVRQAFQHFYNLDYPGAIQLFQGVHQAHPGDPQATALLLEANVFQELYRQDLLDTTFYANDGFLTGRHATEEDPEVRNRIFALSDQAVREADGASAAIPTTWTPSTPADGSAPSAVLTWLWWSVPMAPVSASPPRRRTMSRRFLSSITTTSTPSSWWASTTTLSARCRFRSRSSSALPASPAPSRRA